MSTYLVAFVVCDYHKKSMVTQNQISVSVYAPQHQLHRVEFALETATTLMDFFENFFNVSYSLPKQGLRLAIAVTVQVTKTHFYRQI